MTTPTHAEAAQSQASSPASHCGVITKTLAALLASAALTSAAHAQASSNYSVSHQFSYNVPGNAVDVRAYLFEHAWVANNGLTDEDHFPLVQDPGFDPYGTDTFNMAGFAMNSGLFGAVPDLYFEAPIPPAGIPASTHCTSVLSLPPSQAVACTTFQFDPLVFNPGFVLVKGEIGSAGGVTALPNGRGAAQAYAFSTASVTIRGGTQLGTGQITWNPGFIIDSVGAGTSASFVQDPVIIAHDHTDTFGNLIAEEVHLLHIDANINGNGLLQWNAGVVDFDAPDMILSAEIPPTHVAPGQSGKLYIEIIGGVVTISDGTGVFAPVAPPLGINVPFSVPAPPLSLDYNLGLDPTLNYNVATQLSGGGSSQASFTTCDVDFNNDGFVDSGDINAFIELFLDASPAADLNNDGFIDNGDIASFIDCYLASVGGGGGSDGGEG